MIVHPEGPGLDFLIIISVLLGIATVAIILRILARLEIRAFGVDDWLMVAGWALLVFCCIADYFSISYGVGAHAWRLTDYQIMQAKKWFLIAGAAYVAATAPVKASICVLILRITPSRTYRWLLYGVIALSAIGSIIRIGAFLGRCRPIERAWNPKVDGKCGSPKIMTNVAYFFGALCIVTDVVCAIVPALVIWNVRLSQKVKIYVVVMLALGFLASIATMVRMKYLVAYQDPNDYVYGITNIAIWSEVECTLGIVAGSLATMRPLLKYLRFLGIATESSKSAESGHKMQSVGRQRRSSASKIASSYLARLEGNGRGARGDDIIERDGGSQEQILPEKRLQIFKDTEYRITIEENYSKKGPDHRNKVEPC